MLAAIVRYQEEAAGRRYPSSCSVFSHGGNQSVKLVDINRRMTLVNPISKQPMISGTQIAGELAGRISLATVICRDEPLAKHTTLRVGGRADVFIEPASEADLAGVVKYCRRRNLPFFVIGRGSNLLVRDGGFRGVIICLAHASISAALKLRANACIVAPGRN